jgi:hypothetical protein
MGLARREEAPDFDEVLARLPELQNPSPRYEQRAGSSWKTN